MIGHLSALLARTRKAWASALAVAISTFVLQMTGITDPEAVRAIHTVVGAVLELSAGIVPAVVGAAVAYLVPNRT